MLQRVEVRSTTNELLYTFGVMENRQDDYVIKSADGLDPVKSNFDTFEDSMGDGVVSNGFRVSARSLILEIEYSPISPLSVEERRRNLYRNLYQGSNVRLFFVFTSDTLYIDAYVEEFSAPLFTSQPSVKISFLCPDPYFSRNELQVGTFNGGESVSGFDIGTARAGFTIEIPYVAGLGFLEVRWTGRSALRWNIADWTPDSRYQLSTINGDRYLRIKKGRYTTNVLHRIVRGDLGMSLGGGNRYLRVLSLNDVDFTYKVTYRAKEVGL